jgi:hypothetical protein
MKPPGVDTVVTSRPSPANALAVQLAPYGEKLPPELRARLLAQAPEIVAPLIAILENDRLADTDSVGAGWLPIHAADLLLELKAEAAIPVLIDVLSAGHWDSVLHNKIAVRLPELGAAVLTPAAAAMESATDYDMQTSLCGVLSQLGVRDERVFDWCKEIFERDPVLGGIYFADYGDKRALPLIEGAIEDFKPNWASEQPLSDLREFADAYERIAGELPEHFARVVELHHEVEQARKELAATASEVEALRAAKKVGRNDPCPCGTGKKFKKCCGAND